MSPGVLWSWCTHSGCTSTQTSMKFSDKLFGHSVALLWCRRPNYLDVSFVKLYGRHVLRRIAERKRILVSSQFWHWPSSIGAMRLSSLPSNAALFYAFQTFSSSTFSESFCTYCGGKRGPFYCRIPIHPYLGHFGTTILLAKSTVQQLDNRPDINWFTEKWWHWRFK